jgi:VCBS repeat-containing protein
MRMIRRLVALTLAIALVACGRDTPPQGTAVVTRAVHGAVVKGPLVGASVSFFHVDGAGHAVGAAVATAITDAQGHVSAGLPQSTERLLAVSSGGSYVDESDDAGGDNRRRITLGADQGFEAIVPANADTFVLTPYSMALLLRARRLANGGNFQVIYPAVLQQAVGIFGFDPTAVIPADPLAPDDGGDPKYALLLGGAAYAIGSIATNLGVTPTYSVVRGFIEDLSDGALDARVGDEPFFYTAGDFGAKAEPLDNVDLNGEILRFRNNHFRLYDGVPLIEIDEQEWSAEPPIPDIFPPLAASDAIAVDQGGTATSLVGGAVSVLANDSDPQGGTLTAILLTPPSHGALTLNSNGTFSYVHDGSNAPADLFTYQASNGAQQSPPATVTITIATDNTLPVALDDGYTGHQGQELSVVPPGVLFNDVDADGDELTAVLVTPPAHGTLLLDEDGGFRFTPDIGFLGFDEFTYRANDGHGNSDLATVTLRIIPGNQPPVAVDDQYLAAQGSTLTVASPGILANDNDPEGDPLTVILVSPPDVGTLTLTPQGSFSYTPPNNFTGGTSFEYRLSDGELESNVATVSIAVQAGPPVNHPPVGKDDGYAVEVGGTLNVAAPGVLGNDTDPDGDPLVAQLVNGPTQGNLTLNPNGSFQYQHSPPVSKLRAKSAQDQFTYRASDGDLVSNLITVTITITPANFAPTGVADSYSVAFGGTLSVPAPGVLGNDSDPNGDPLSAELVSGPSLGNLTLNADGSFDYTHTPPPPSKALRAKAVIQDQFTYRVSDGELTSDNVIVTITINRAPFGNIDNYTINTGGTLTIAAPGVLGNDGDPDGNTITAVLVDSPTLGNLTFNGDGSFVYQNTTSGPQDEFTYQVDDGMLQSSLITVTITIDSPPIGTADTYFVSPGVVLVVEAPGVLDNDTDPDGDSLTAVLETSPAKGTLVFNPDGSFMYQPFAGLAFNEPPDQFTYRVADGPFQSDPVTVTLEFFLCDCSFPEGRHSPVLTQDGSTVVFLSEDMTLDPAKTTSGITDIFVTTFNAAIAAKASHAKVSIEGATTFRLMGPDAGPNDGDVTTGVEPNGSVTAVNITPDGHYLVFTTFASNYGTTTAGFSSQVYRYSLSGADAGEIKLVSAPDDSSNAGNGFSNFSQAISDDGNYVAFQSNSSDLTGFAPAGFITHVYRRDIAGVTTTLISIDWLNSNAADSPAFVSSISADGNLISFESDASDIVPPDNAKAFANGFSQTYVRNVSGGGTTMASVSSLDVAGDGNSSRSWLSPDGSLVAIETLARNLIASDGTAAGLSEIIVHKLSDGTNLRPSGFSDPDGSSFLVANPFSSDNQFVSFVSQATNIVANDTNDVQDVFVHGFVTGATARVNVDASSNEAVSGSRNQSHALSRDGSKIAFDSNAINLDDPTGEQQVYVVDNPLFGVVTKSWTPARQAARR